MVAGAALNVELCCLRRHDRGTDDYSGYSNKPRDGERIQVADRHIFGARMQQELVIWKFDVGLVGMDNSVRTPLQGCFELDKVRMGSTQKQRSPVVPVE